MTFCIKIKTNPQYRFLKQKNLTLVLDISKAPFELSISKNTLENRKKLENKNLENEMFCNLKDITKNILRTKLYFF